MGQATSAGRFEAVDLLSPVRKFWCGDWPHKHRWTTAVGAVLPVSILTAATGAIHARLYGHDIFFLLDNGWRALHGKRVHLDYSSAWGPLTFLLIAAGLAVSRESVAAVSYADAMAALAVGVWAIWLAAGRSRTLTGILYPTFVALLAAAPFVIGEAPAWTSHGMVYNRYGYALLAILLLECFQPPADDSSPRRRVIEPVLSGCVVGLLLFLKITYFLIALPIVGTSLVFWERRKQRALGCAAGFAGAAFLFLAYLRWDVAAMAGDLAAAAAARSGTLSMRHGTGELLAGAIAHVMPLGILAYGAATMSASRRQLWRYLLIAVLAVTADTLLLITNAQPLSYPLAATCAILLLFPLEPALSRAGTGDIQRKAGLFVIMAGILAGPTVLVQAVGLGHGLVEARGNSELAGVLRFESARLRPLVLYDAAPDNPDRFSDGREYVASINDGMSLLAARTRADEKVATLDMFNPFAYALGREPIAGGIASAAYRYTLDDRHHPSPARFFGDAAVLMVPKYPTSQPFFYDGYRKIYEPTIEREFRLEAEPERWRLYRRVAGSAN